MAHQSCAVGCRKVPGQTLHVFPRDPQRRAQWCRILGVYPRTKRAKLCNTHIPDYYFNGPRLSKFALPNPPDSRVITNAMLSMNSTKINYMRSFSELYHDNCSSAFPKTETCTLPTETKCNDIRKDTLEETINMPTTSEAEIKTETSQEPFSNVENFEIRRSNGEDKIIKGRYIQTNDYLIVSYTPPRKWSLQEQVNALDKTCTQQLIRIKEQNRKIYHLIKELKKYEKLLPKLRFLQTHNRFIYAQLKMYKIQAKNRRKRIKNRLKNNKSKSVQ